MSIEFEADKVHIDIAEKIIFICSKLKPVDILPWANSYDDDKVYLNMHIPGIVEAYIKYNKRLINVFDLRNYNLDNVKPTILVYRPGNWIKYVFYLYNKAIEKYNNQHCLDHLPIDDSEIFS